VSGRPRLRAYLAFAVAGFRRHSTYRQATVAACVTNSVFGFLRAAVMLALFASQNVIGGWLSQKLNQPPVLLKNQGETIHIMVAQNWDLSHNIGLELRQ